MTQLKTLALLLLVTFAPACLAESECSHDACLWIEKPDECTRNGEPVPCPEGADADAARRAGGVCWRDDDGIGRCELPELPAQP